MSHVDFSGTFVSLFSGGGGLDVGLHLATGGLLRRGVYVEREAYALACLAARIEAGALAPGPLWTDVSTFDGRPLRGLVGVVCGGSPCQDLSVAGRRAGLDGARSGLFFHFVRIVEECQPALVFWENVGGAASSLPRVFDAFAAVGYRGAAVTLRASDVGATHRRARVFLLAYRYGDGLALLRACRVHGRGDAPGDDAAGCGTEVGDANSGPRDEGSAQRSGGDSGGDADARGGLGGAGSRQVAHSFGLESGHQPGWECGTSRPGASESGDEGEDVADAHGRILRHDEQSGRRAGPFTPDARPDVADARSEGLEGWGIPGSPGAQQPEPRHHCGFPPGPDDGDGWREYLARGGPSPAQPRLCRGVDGLGCGCVDAVWADRLRLLGNGVVPQQAAAAFTFLAERLTQ